MVNLAKSKNKHITRKTKDQFGNSSGYLNDLNSALTEVDPYLLYQKSIGSHKKRLSPKSLRVISKIIPVQRALSKISNGVLNMKWKVTAPLELEKNNPEEANRKRQIIKNSILRPNYSGEINTYRKLIHAVIDDLICLNRSIIEKQSGNDKKPFWFWVCDPERIVENIDWTPQDAGITPKYFEINKGTEETELYDSEAFAINLYANSYQSNAESPLEIAYRMINFWIGITNYQGKTTAQPTRNAIICLEELEDISGDEGSELEAFREWWQMDVVGLGKHPIVGGTVNIKHLGGNNDQELFPQYTEFVLKMIALALNMSPRDFNITEKDNRATSLVAADATYQDAILPIAQTILESLSIELVDFYFPGFGLEFTSLEPRSFEKEAKVSVDLYKNGVITKNESRDRIGEERLDPEIGNVFSDGKSSIDPTENTKENKNEDEKPESKDKKNNSENVKQESSLNIRNSKDQSKLNERQKSIFNH